jgi:dTDP-4-dehydrorhamnose reductase
MTELEALAPVVVVGADGMLGRAWCALLKKQSIPFHAAMGGEIELRDSASIERHVPAEARTVVNCAAWTDVDGAEANEADAHAINAAGVAALAERCKQVSAILLHYSTDYVFDGRASRPYPIDQPLEPVNAYGRSKARGEELLRQSGCPHLLVRTSWLYAPWGKNFVRTMAELVTTRSVVRVVDDQRGRPSSAEALAARSLALLEHGASGTFHVTDDGECSWFELASAIAAAVRPACRIEPCSSADYVRPARRPAYSVLDTSATDALLGPAASWQLNLRAVLTGLEPAT